MQIDHAAPDTTSAGNAGEEIDMMKVAMEADAAPDMPLGDEQPEATGATPDAAKTADGKDGKPAAPGAKKTDEKGQKTEDGNKPTADKTAKPGAKGESEFSKAKGEQERRERSWKALDEEKAQFRQDKQAIMAELQGLRREVVQLRTAKPAGPAKDAHGYTAADYDKLAKEYENSGDDRMANAARERAETLRNQAQPSAAGNASAEEPWKSPEFQAEWQRHTQELIAQDKELANPDNPLVKATNALVNDPTYGRFFRAGPDGIKAAVEVAKIMQQAHATAQTREQLTAVQEELKTTKAEIERLNGLLQPRGSHPAGPAKGAKSAGQLTDDDVRALAAAADRGELDN